MPPVARRRGRDQLEATGTSRPRSNFGPSSALPASSPAPGRTEEGGLRAGEGGNAGKGETGAAGGGGEPGGEILDVLEAPVQPDEPALDLAAEGGELGLDPLREVPSRLSSGAVDGVGEER